MEKHSKFWLYLSLLFLASVEGGFGQDRSLPGGTLSARCDAVEGADTVFAKQAVRFILVGELHGTDRAPKLFADLVCEATRTGRPIVVALEQEVESQLALDQYLQSLNEASASRELVSSPLWAGSTQDGRKSLATFQMIRELKALKLRGQVQRIAAFDPGAAVGNREEGMARNVASLAENNGNAIVLVFTGNIHGAKKPVLGSMRMAGYLPNEETFSLLIADKGGMSWSCDTSSCGPKRLGISSELKRGVHLGEAWMSGYDGTLAIGETVSAAPPAYREIR